MAIDALTVANITVTVKGIVGGASSISSYGIDHFWRVIRPVFTLMMAVLSVKYFGGKSLTALVSKAGHFESVF